MRANQFSGPADQRRSGAFRLAVKTLVLFRGMLHKTLERDGVPARPIQIANAILGRIRASDLPGLRLLDVRTHARIADEIRAGDHRLEKGDTPVVSPEDERVRERRAILRELRCLG